MVSARIDDYLEDIPSTVKAGFRPGHPADDATLALLAHVAFSDGEVSDSELQLLGRVLPGRNMDQLRAWAKQAGSRPVALDAVAAALPEPDDRWLALRYAARMAARDGKIVPQERELLQRAAEAFGLPGGAERVLDEVRTRFERPLDRGLLIAALRGYPWDAVQLAGGDCETDLGRVIPKGSSVIARVGLERVEVLGFTETGIAGRFSEGLAFLRWADIVGYTRLGRFGAAVRLHLEDGAAYTLVDQRLRGIGPLLDRLFASGKRPTGAAPLSVTKVRGKD